MYVQQCLCPGCTEVAVQGRESDVQLLGLLLVASAGTCNSQCMYGLLVCGMAWEWLLSFQTE